MDDATKKLIAEEVKNLILEDMKKNGYIPGDIKFITSCGNKYDNDGNYIGHISKVYGPILPRI